MSILKKGDFVKYHKELEELNDVGLVLGETYEVGVYDGAFAVQTGYHGAIVELIDAKGKLTDATNHFSIKKCPLILPRGLES